MELVTGNYFSTLDLNAAKGRFFLPEEDNAPGAHAVAVLNYGTWERYFGSAPDVIGRTLRINRVAFTVIGVAPPKFIGVNAIFGPDLWIPASMAEQFMPYEMRDALTERSKAMFLCVGRLKPGVSREQAQANVATVAAALSRQYPEANEGRSATVRPIRDAIFNSASSATSNITFGGMILLAVVGIVLLIACSNVANLLLARAAARQHEIAVRLAIGASRGRLIRQLLTESACLELLSGMAGLALGIAGVRALWAALPQACIYIPLEQNYSDAMTLYVRSKSDPQQIMVPVQREVRAAGPGIMVNDIRTGRAIMDNGLFQAKIAVMLLSIFGMLALGMASVGLYGIMAYAVHQRTREIGGVWRWAQAGARY